MKIEKILMVVFGGVGVALLVGGGYWGYRQNEFVKNSSRAAGTVTQLARQVSTREGRSSYSYYPEVRFKTAEGRQIVFISSTGSNPPSFRVGEEVEVVYDPRNPDKAEINSFWSLYLGPMVLLLIGIVFSGVGGGIAVFKIRGARKIAWLKQHGQRIQADVIEVGLNSSTTVNGRHPYCISAQWRDPRSGQIHVFTSEDIWFNPEQYIQAKSVVEVLIDPEKPRRYWIDVSFLPQVAE